MKSISILAVALAILFGHVAVAQGTVQCSVLTSGPEEEPPDMNKVLLQAVIPSDKKPGEQDPHLYFLIKKDLSAATVTTVNELNRLQSDGFKSNTGDAVITMVRQYVQGQTIIASILDPSYAWDDSGHQVSHVVGNVSGRWLDLEGLALIMPNFGAGVFCERK